MKKIQVIFSMALFIVLMNSCEMGIKKDLITGLSVSNQDLNYENASVYVEGNKTTDTEFPIKSMLELRVEGINGFTEENGVVYVGASMTVSDIDNNEILNYPDLFSEYDSTGFSPMDAKQITLTLTTADPLVSGHKYIWRTRIWDKKGNGEITTEMEMGLK